jgi:Gpi18-like mannosyltransferase
MIARGALFYYESGDYIYFLRPWIEQYRTMSFIEGLSTRVSNYNPPYTYILNIISKINYSDLFLIKIISVTFDLILAYFVMKIVSLKTTSINMHILAFMLTFAIPTVMLNGAMWGQCDSIYSALAVGSVYFGLSKRSKHAYAFMALAISFKLQAAFLLPMLPVFVCLKKIKLKDAYIFLLVYMATLLPAILAGMSIDGTILAYYSQVNYFSSLNMNAVNIWRFVDNVEYDNFLTMGLYTTGAAVLGLMYFSFVHRERLKENTDIVRLAYLFAVIMPFMLPKMHDRYYFMADALSVAVFLFDKRRWYVPVVTISCSYLTYAYFLMSGITLFDYKTAAIALFVIIIIVLQDYVKSLLEKTNF